MNKLINKTGRAGLMAGACVALFMMSNGANAGQYDSEVDFPYIYASGEVHKIHIPFSREAPDRIKVKNVSWTWGRHGNIQRYNVKLCQMMTNSCKDITYHRSGSSTEFGRGDAALPFYFLVTSVGRPFNPEWGLKGTLKVEW